MSLVGTIAEKLQLSSEYIKKIERNASRLYKMYKIPKKGNGYRVIYQPSQELKTLQYWLNRYVFDSLPVSKFSFAYTKGCSIKKNALAHKDSRYFLHLDLKNFFESITRHHLVDLLISNSKFFNCHGVYLEKQDIDFICNICLRYGNLTIGSVCSPTISNRVMYEFDLEIKEVIGNDIIYTRYADDLVFSSIDFIPIDMIQRVGTIAKKYKFGLNNLKTKFMSCTGRRIVTGLIIDNGKVSIGLKRRRKIKSMLYNKIVKGQGDSQRILGYLFFLKDIEPAYFNKIMLKYSHFGNVLEMLKNDRIIMSNLKHSMDEAAAVCDIRISRGE